MADLDFGVQKVWGTLLFSLPGVSVFLLQNQQVLNALKFLHLSMPGNLHKCKSYEISIMSMEI